ncbi:MAG TPA: 50S ribosomal protein L1 [Fimbriimonadaceae bacterium]|nr:50S ribosomal protein L1 [Fimbriimonadaceae bacterium]HRJ34015.1 50S ribosomal protein L1 [Fimbriimonadaceae bacterium]
MRKNIKKLRHSPRFDALLKQVDQETPLEVTAALDLVKKTANAKFVETVDVAVRLGIDPKKGDQNVRGLATLPNGTGKVKKVAVLAKGDFAKEAEDAGADVVGADELIAKIQGGFKDFDVILATEEMAPQIGKIGKMLGPKTPNKRNGTVTNAIGQAVKEIKAATRVEYRADKAGVVHLPLGKVNFSNDQLIENFNEALKALVKAKPSSAKGKYLISITLSSTMGPGVPVDPALAQKAAGV